MSKNFEVLSRIGIERGAVPLEAATTFDVSVLLEEKRPQSDKCGSSLRPEILKLVNVLFLAPQNAPRCVLFCGVDETDDSQGVCISIARALAKEVPQKICLMDAKLSGSCLEESLETADGPFSSPDPTGGIDEYTRQIGENLWFLSATTILSVSLGNNGSVHLCSALLRLRREFDYVLVHTPPAGTDRVASVLGQVADGVVLVLEANNTRRVTARSAKETLEAAKVRLLGTVLNNRTFPIPEKLYRRL